MTNQNKMHHYETIPFYVGNVNDPSGLKKMSFRNTCEVVAINAVTSESGDVTILYTVKTQ